MMKLNQKSLRRAERDINYAVQKLFDELDLSDDVDPRMSIYLHDHDNNNSAEVFDLLDYQVKEKNDSVWKEVSQGNLTVIVTKK